MEGYNDVAAVFCSHGKKVRLDMPMATWSTWKRRVTRQPGLPIGATSDNRKAAIAGETHEYTDMYPGMAKPRGTKVSGRNRRLDGKHWPRPSAVTPTASRRPWTRWTADPSPDRRATRARPLPTLPNDGICGVKEPEAPTPSD